MAEKTKWENDYRHKLHEQTSSSFTYLFTTCDLTSVSGPDDEIDDDDTLLCQRKRRKICSASK